MRKQAVVQAALTSLLSNPPLTISCTKLSFLRTHMDVRIYRHFQPGAAVRGVVAAGGSLTRAAPPRHVWARVRGGCPRSSTEDCFGAVRPHPVSRGPLLCHCAHAAQLHGRHAGAHHVERPGTDAAHPEAVRHAVCGRGPCVCAWPLDCHVFLPRLPYVLQR